MAAVISAPVLRPVPYYTTWPHTKRAMLGIALLTVAAIGTAIVLNKQGICSLRTRQIAVVASLGLGTIAIIVKAESDATRRRLASPIAEQHVDRAASILVDLRNYNGEDKETRLVDAQAQHQQALKHWKGTDFFGRLPLPPS